MGRPTLPERIDAALAEAGGKMTMMQLATRLYPDKKSWNYSSNGGPAGLFMSLSAGVSRGGFHRSYECDRSGQSLPGPGHCWVHARPLPNPRSPEQ